MENPKPTLRSFLDIRGVLLPVAWLTRDFGRLTAASTIVTLGVGWTRGRVVKWGLSEECENVNIYSCKP